MCANIDVDDDALRAASQSGISIGHGKSDHLVRTCDDLGKLALLFILAFDDGFDDGWVVASQVDKAMRDAGLPDGLEKGEGCCVPSAHQ